MERKEDLEKGQARYESVVSSRKLPGWRKRHRRYRVIHNNLGYVLMMRGEVWANEARTAEDRGSIRDANRRRRKAATLWKKAERHMRIVIAVAPPQYNTKAYSWANLGNLQRLRGQFIEAEKSYAEAMEAWKEARTLHPSQSGPDVYVDGLAERARLFVETGDIKTALEDHRSALSAAQSASHRFKIARMLLIACEGADLLQAPESLESATEWLSDGEGPSIEDWVDRMRGLLSRDRTPDS